MNTIIALGGMIITFGAGYYVAKNKFESMDFQSSKEGNRTNPLPSKPLANPQPTPSEPMFSLVEAQHAFLSNVEHFVPYFNSLIDGTFVKGDWDDAIIDVNNSDLIGFWMKLGKQPESILKMLSMWGIKRDLCTSFDGLECYSSMYDTVDGSSLMASVNYHVVSPCWLLTDNSTGQKSVILKGIVEYGKD